MASTSAPSKVVCTGGRLSHSRCTSGPRTSAISASKASSRPGSIRPSTVARATDGTTLAVYPASNRVGEDQREAVLFEPGDRRGESGDGVVGLQHRCVPGSALGLEAQPRDALLGGLDEVGPH